MTDDRAEQQGKNGQNGQQWRRWLLSLAGFIVLIGPGCASSRATRGDLSSEALKQKMRADLDDRYPPAQYVVGIGVGNDLEGATTAAYFEIMSQLPPLPLGYVDALHKKCHLDQHAADNQGRVHVLAALEREEASAHLRQLAHGLETKVKDQLPRCRQLIQDKKVSSGQSCLARRNVQLAQARDLLTASHAVLERKNAQ